MWVLRGALGIVALLGFCWLASEKRRHVDWKVVAWGMGLQFCIAAAMLKIPTFQKALLFLNRGVGAIERASHEGGAFVFGYLTGGQAPFVLRDGLASAPAVFVFGPLMMLIVVGAISSVLFHVGLLQKVVGLFARALHRTMGLGGAEGVAVAANVFMGQGEASLLIKPYVEQLGRPGLLCVMTAGMTTISGSLMVVYSSMLDGLMPGLVLGHLVVASIISAPAAVMVARILIPASAEEVDREVPDLRSESHGVMDALLAGAGDGAKVVVNVAVMLVAIIALVSLTNELLGLLPLTEPLSLQRAMGWAMAPAMWVVGLPWGEAQAAGELMSLKTVFNEFVAYAELSRMPPDAFTGHGRLVVVYSLCGFANFSSIGILVGALSAMCPSKKGEIAALGLKSMVAGTVAALLTGAVVGILRP